MIDQLAETPRRRFSSTFIYEANRAVTNESPCFGIVAIENKFCTGARMKIGPTAINSAKVQPINASARIFVTPSPNERFWAIGYI